MTEDAHRRGSRLINHEMVDTLALPANEAVVAAKLLDRELARRLKEEQSAVLAMIGLFNTTRKGSCVAPLLEHVARMGEAKRWRSRTSASGEIAFGCRGAFDHRGHRNVTGLVKDSQP
jgi:hypothetical protein